MKQIRKRLTYANVMSSIAVFLVLGGATAFAAKKIGTNEIKANSITTRQDQEERGHDRQDQEQGGNQRKDQERRRDRREDQPRDAGHRSQRPRTPTSQTAWRDGLRSRSSIGPGARNVATVGPFTIRVQCAIDAAGEDEGTFQLFTSVDGAAMDDNEGNEIVPFDVADSPAELFSEDTTDRRPGPGGLGRARPRCRRP